MEQTNPVKILQVSKVAPPSSNSTCPEISGPHHECSLPLTFFDTLWTKVSPMEQLFYYSILDLDSSLFFNSILPTLKHTLSLTLQHYFPLAGKLTWPENSSKPFILYKPGDSVSLVVAEYSLSDSTDQIFNHLSGHTIREAKASHLLLPKRHEANCNDTIVPILAFQVTLFRNHGFCIGMSFHHAVVDGKSLSMILKSWAYLCNKLVTSQDENKEITIALPRELIPIFDRTLVIDRIGLDMHALNLSAKLYGSGRHPKSLKCSLTYDSPPDMVHGTFEITREDVGKLKRRLSEQAIKTTQTPLHLSTFVVSLAYFTTCLIKSSTFDGKEKVHLKFPADYRGRLEPPVPANYIGNCFLPLYVTVEARECRGKDGLERIAKKLSDIIIGLEKKALGVEERISKMDPLEMNPRIVGVAWSPKYEVYELDFGWGRPIKHEFLSIEWFPGKGISMSDCPCRNGGVEIGLFLPKDEMDPFVSLFYDGIKTL